VIKPFTFARVLIERLRYQTMVVGRGPGPWSLLLIVGYLGSGVKPVVRRRTLLTLRIRSGWAQQWYLA